MGLSDGRDVEMTLVVQLDTLSDLPDDAIAKLLADRLFNANTQIVVYGVHWEGRTWMKD